MIEENSVVENYLLSSKDINVNVELHSLDLIDHFGKCLHILLLMVGCAALLHKLLEPVGVELRFLGNLGVSRGKDLFGGRRRDLDR